MAATAWSVFILSLLALALVGGVILIVVLLLVGRRKSPQPVVSPAAPTAVSSDERRAILKRLADGELTREEAERQMAELGTPVPAAMPPPSQESGAGKGCLVAAIVIIVVFLLLLLLAIGLHFGINLKRHKLVEEDMRAVHRARMEEAIRRHQTVVIRPGPEVQIAEPSEPNGGDE